MMSESEAMTPFLMSGADDLGARLLHAGGQLAHADGVGDLDLELGLFGYLELELLHALALLGAALGAGGGLLLALLLLVLELLLAALDVVARVRAGEAVEALVILAEVHVAAAARVYDALLGHLARDVGLCLLGRRALLGALLLLGLGGLRLLGLCLLRLRALLGASPGSAAWGCGCGSGFFAAGFASGTLKRSSIVAHWLCCVRYSKTRESSESSSTCIWFLGAVAYLVRISADGL